MICLGYSLACSFGKLTCSQNIHSECYTCLAIEVNRGASFCQLKSRGGCDNEDWSLSHLYAFDRIKKASVCSAFR